jgi:hypothetical protein
MAGKYWQSTGGGMQKLLSTYGILENGLANVAQNLPSTENGLQNLQPTPIW